MKKLALLAALYALPLHAQTRTYAQILFKNGGADLYRDSLGLRLQIGSGSDPRRTVVLRIPPDVALGLSVALKAPCPQQDTLVIGPYSGVTWRCTAAGWWIVMTTPGLGSYFRPSPNVPADRLPLIRAAIVNALKAADVPAVVIDLR